MTSRSFATADCRRRRGVHNKQSSVDPKDTSAGSGRVVAKYASYFLTLEYSVAFNKYQTLQNIPLN
jgi:hypothetical protein